MFNEHSQYEEAIKELLLLYSDDLDRLFEELDITLESVLEILFEGGHAQVPPYVSQSQIEQREEDYSGNE